MGVSPRNYLPHIAESVKCVSLLLVSIVLFFDVSVSYRIYYMYHGFEGYMANIRPEHRDIGTRRSRGPISRCEGLIYIFSKLIYVENSVSILRCDTSSGILRDNYDSQIYVYTRIIITFSKNVGISKPKKHRNKIGIVP